MPGPELCRAGSVERGDDEQHEDLLAMARPVPVRPAADARQLLVTSR
jgi:hypothetical protein